MSLPTLSLARIAGTVALLSGAGTAAAPFTPSAAHMPRAYLMTMLVAGAVLLILGGVALVLARTPSAAAKSGSPVPRTRS